MKKAIGILAACTLILLAGCSAQTTASAAGSMEDSMESSMEKKLTVCTSFYAMYDFAEKIGGDKIGAVNLVPAGTEPHDWEPSSSNDSFIIKLKTGDFYFFSGWDGKNTDAAAKGMQTANENI